MYKELSSDCDLLRQTVMYRTHVKGFRVHVWSELLITEEETKTRIEELIIIYDRDRPLGCCTWACTVYSVSQPRRTRVLIWKMESNHHLGLGLH